MMRRCIALHNALCVFHQEVVSVANAAGLQQRRQAPHGQQNRLPYRIPFGGVNNPRIFRINSYWKPPHISLRPTASVVIEHDVTTTVTGIIEIIANTHACSSQQLRPQNVCTGIPWQTQLKHTRVTRWQAMIRIPGQRCW
jgi:hypothetical protein